MSLRIASYAVVVFIAACAGATPTSPTVPAGSAGQDSTQSKVEALDREGALVRLFSAQKIDPAWFDAAFLAAVPLAQVEQIQGQIRDASGALENVRVEGKQYVVTFERSTWEGSIDLDDAGRITMLLVRPAAPNTSTIEEALTAFRGLVGKVSVLVLTDDVEVGAIEPTLPLAVGSSFKLALLVALRAEIEGKKRAWTDVLEVAEADHSLPSGILQDWPDRAPVTLHTLASLMISMSDNTATDVLLNAVGRSSVEALSPRNRPFLATRELFQLKVDEGSAALKEYQKGDEAARRKVLESLRKAPLPNVENYPTTPTALDVEWFFSARELCDLMKKVHDLPLMGINPGVAKKVDWDSVAYKGGSEPGVLNMTTWLKKGNRNHCVTATWNSSGALDQMGFMAAYGRAIAALKK